MSEEFTHIDSSGNIRMVNVTDKEDTHRKAVACGIVTMKPDTLEKIMGGDVKKGNVIEAARIAGIMAAKKTLDLIPMCHPINVTYVSVDFRPDPERNSIEITSEVRTFGKTGVEIEAITAVAIAAVTIYDMCKSYDRAMVISDIRLIEKFGGKSGHFIAK
ncbi:MAG: cyclic pyranopterin monophosphate synthase MoaC [Desulfococcus sp. 4484_241]|nr:MAG: cyclic pyranopterin monophosphate synthase MoaC [Desulfococcus sp. 4484_241]